MNKFPVQYARILLKLTEGLSGKALDAALTSYISYLYTEQALGKIKYILREYVRLAQQETGTESLIVTAAHELTPDAKQAIEAQFGGKIEHVTINKSLVGGVVVRRGNTILNASISKQLELLANSMK